MKVALVIAGSIWFSPYVRIYTRLLESLSVDYSIISWNREGDDKPEGFQYNVNSHSPASFSAYRGYVKFIKKTIREQGFDKVIVFGPQMACLLSSFLLVHYRNRYMIDYRDLSIEQKPGFRQLFSLMLKFSCLNVVSSPGFIKCLPKRKYYISHNFDVKTVREAITKSTEGSFFRKDGIKVLTIGGIRDYSSNIEVVKALGNKAGIRLDFVGKGGAAEQIKEYCQIHAIHNIGFKGFYQKEEEPAYIQACTFMNIFYPRVITHDTALSNRFYNSLIYKKPMIVTKDTTQGNYAEEHRVGIVIADCGDLEQQLHSFLECDFGDYATRCNNLLKSFLIDQEEFEIKVKQFVTSVH